MQNPFIMVHLLSAVYWFDEALQATLKEAGMLNITRAQSMIIANIAAGERRATSIARNLGVTRQAVSLMIAELEERGVLEVAPDPDDGRARVVRFSNRSTVTTRAAEKILQYLEEQLVERIGLSAYLGLRDAIMKDWGTPPKVPATVIEGKTEK